ncbi:MAG: CAP domain-containing protein [Devosiaceae bacterium]|nr:CAP domain-containing protein [Devosiaceae bacterium]
MNLRLLTKRNFLILGLGGTLSACSQYLPEGSTSPVFLSREIIMTKINATRAANGVKALAYNPVLEKAAQIHVRLMAQKGELSHELGGTLRERVTAVGYQGAVGENLAGGQDTLEDAIKGWLESRPHRNTLLNPKFTEFGFAVAEGGGEYEIYWAMIFGSSFEAWLG